MLSKEEAKNAVDSNVGSIEKLCKQAVCTADINLLEALGVDENPREHIANMIRSEAKSIGVHDLVSHYNDSVESGRSNVVNLIVRKKHKLYFATRSSLHPLDLLKCLRKDKSDLCEYLYESANQDAYAGRAERRKRNLENEVSAVRRRLNKLSKWKEGGV